MRALHSPGPACLAIGLLLLTGCSERAPMQVDGARHQALTGEAGPAGPAGPDADTPPRTSGEWVADGDGSAPAAAWRAPSRGSALSLYCDAAAGRIVLERDASALPDDVRVVTLEADGIRMDYPGERVSTDAGTRLVTRIALDAPVLDRLLATPQLTVRTGAESIATSAPGPTLGPIVDACRARH